MNPTGPTPPDTDPRDSPGDQRPSAGGGVEKDRFGGLRAQRGVQVAQLLERQPRWARDFTDLSFEWRRLFSEVFGTFLLVMVGAGGAVVNGLTHGGIGRVAGVTAPGLLVIAVILFMGAVSGAHLNPVVTLAFALRRDFEWRRVPGYVAAQIVGAVLACGVLRAAFGPHLDFGASHPGAGFSSGQAVLVEALLTLGLVSTILGPRRPRRTSAHCPRSG